MLKNISENSVENLDFISCHVAGQLVFNLVESQIQVSHRERGFGHFHNDILATVWSFGACKVCLLC